MAKQENEFLNQGDLNQNVSGAEADEIPQKRNDALLFRETRAQQKARQQKNESGGDEADRHQAEQQWDGSIDFEIGACAVRGRNVAPQIAGLNGVEKERAVVADGRDIEGIIAPELLRVGGGEQLCEGVFGRVARQIDFIHVRFGDYLACARDIGVGK